MGNQLAEAESLLQKQDLLQTQVSALGESIGIISSTAAKVQQQEKENTLIQAEGVFFIYMRTILGKSGCVY